MIPARDRKLALLVAGCFFMENLDITIVTTAAPRIAADLHVRPTAISMVITAYVLTLAVLIPVSGWMSARWGSRPVFLSAIAIFTLGSLACAASSTLGELVAMRVVQGVGGAMMVPVGRLVVLARTAKADLMRIISYLVWPGLIAPVIAPLVGGVITTYASWRWLFLINIPLGLIAFAAAWRLTDSLPGERPPRLDWTGALLTCSGLAGLTYTAHLLAEPAIPWPTAIGLGLASIGLLAAAVRHLLGADAPLINLRTLRVPTFRASVGGTAAFFIPVGATPFLLPLLFETVFHWSAVKAGAIVLFVFVGNIGIKPATTYLYTRFGFRTMLVAATATLAASMLACGLLQAGTPLALIVLIVLVSGIARSVGLTGYSTMTFSDVPPQDMRDANTLAASSAQLAVGLGVAVAAVALRLGQALGTGLTDSHTPNISYTIAFAILALVTLGPLIGALRLQPGAGDVLRTGARKKRSSDGQESVSEIRAGSG